MRVSFLGLGAMGFPMAGHLATASPTASPSPCHSVKVYNRSSEKAARWAKTYKGEVATSPRQAVEGAEVVFLCLGGDEDVRAVLHGEEGVLKATNEASVLVDHTTTSAQLARETFQAAKTAGISFIDAPVSGGEKGAQDGKLTVMCGGEKPAYERALPAMQCYARECLLMGESGSGQLAKMVNQICIAGVLQGLAEGLHFAKRAKLDRGKLLQAIRKGAAQSWQMDNRGETMCEGKFDFGFASEWMLKDLRYCLEEGRRNGAPLALVEEVVGYYEELIALGRHRRSDSSALIARFEQP